MRLIAVTLAAVALVAQPADRAWLFLVDDLHIEFMHTGRLRDLLRTAAKELIGDGDRYLLRASGPSGSGSVAATADRDLIVPAIRFMTGNGLKAIDITRNPAPAAVREVLYRDNVSLDTFDNAVTALAAEEAPRKAMILVSWGFDIEGFPAIADRLDALASRARASGIAIFAIDARGFGADLLPDPRVDASAWQRYLDSTRRSLSLIAEGTGGFVVERVSEPHADLNRIAAQMR